MASANRRMLWRRSHLRYCTINEQEGMMTLDEDFEVDLNRKGESHNPFYVSKL